MSTIRITLAQQPAPAGDLAANQALLGAQVHEAADMGAEVLLTAANPLTGDCGDLGREPGFASAVRTAEGEALRCATGTTVRTVRSTRVSTTNTPSLYASVSRSQVAFGCVTDLDDLFRAISHAARQDAAVIAISAALPYQVGGPEQRRSMLIAAARQHGRTIVFVNRVGGADRLVYDGGSMVISPAGKVLLQAPLFEPFTSTVTLDLDNPTVGQVVEWPTSVEEQVYTALVIGTRDYILGNGFSDVVIGLSGGIDSAVVAVIAADALGFEHVHGVGMPGPYSSEGSVTDAAALAENLGVRFDLASIAQTYEAQVAALGDLLEGPGAQVAKENIQARLRALHLFTIANARNSLVLNTCNKSEDAVGYATIGGDSMGAYAPLADVPKTLVYRLAQWRNRKTLGGPIPEATITKPPSAELAPDQQDTDTLPPYDVLDTIIEQHLNRRDSTKIVEGLVADFGLTREDARATVTWVLTMIDRNEWKRQQGPLGPQITPVPFAARSVPVTNRRRH